MDETTKELQNNITLTHFILQDMRNHPEATV